MITARNDHEHKPEGLLLHEKTPKITLNVTTILRWNDTPKRDQNVLLLIWQRKNRKRATQKTCSNFHGLVVKRNIPTILLENIGC